MNKLTYQGVATLMSTLVGIRGGLSAVNRWSFFGQRRLVWLFGLTGVPIGAPAFFPTNALNLCGAVQAVPECGPFIAIGKRLHQNSFRAEPVATV